jgi:arylsulfatase A-like enzyme/predicted Zn-dependent protease
MGVACALMAAGLGCGRSDGSRLPAGTPIVVISIDTLRSDRLPVYGYGLGDTPAIDALAAEAVRFERAYTQVPLTLPAHVSLLTGLLPPAHGVRDNLGYPVDPERAPMLQQLLQKHGYATGAAVSAYVLRGGTGFSAGFDFFDDDLELVGGAGLQAIQRPGFETLDRVRPWLRSVAGRPFFLLFHIFEPHSPYEPPEPFASRFGSPYDGEVAAADAVVGALLAELRELGVYDRALIALLSDHGEGLGEHGEDEHGLLLYRSTLQVPLLVKLPGAERAGAVVEHPVQLIDVVPTVLEGLGIAVEERLPGRSLLAPAPEPGEVAVYAETVFPKLHFGWSDLGSLIVGRHQLIDAPRPELYDLEADPDQAVNLAGRDPETAAALSARLERWDRSLAAPGASDAETRRRLEALGYLGSATVAADGQLPDPKDKVGVLRELRRAYGLLAVGENDRAAAAFADVVAEEPGVEDAWDYLGQAHLRSGSGDRALAAYLRGLQEIPGSARLALGAAGLLYRGGRLDEAQELATLGISHNEAAARTLLAQIALVEGRLERAESEARQAVAAARSLPGPVLVLSQVLLMGERPEEAREVLERALAEGVDTEAVRVRLAGLLVAAGEPRAAEDLLAGLESSDDPETLVAVGRLAAMRGDGERAGELFERALDRDPGNPAAAINLGMLALTRGRSEQARSLLERGLEGAPASFEGWNALGVARARSGDAQGAITAWQRALELQPQAVDLLFNLGLAHAQAGDPARAADYLEAFVERGQGPQRDQAREMARQLRRRAASGR